MKKYTLIFLLTFFVQLIFSQNFRKYPIKSGMIKYETDVMGTKGTSILYWDEYGFNEVQIENSPSLSNDGTIETKTTLFLGSKQYVWGNNDEAVTAFTNPIAKVWETNGYQGDEAISLGEELMKNMLGAPIGGKKIFLGKECDVFKNDEMMLEALGWKGLTLMIKIASMSTQTATSIETDIELPANTFALPEGKEIKETNPMQGFKP